MIRAIGLLLLIFIVGCSQPQASSAPSAVPPTAAAPAVATPPVATPPTGATPAGSAAPPAANAAPATSVDLVSVATGLTSPLFVTHAGDATLYVVEKGGRIRAIANGSVRNESFLDITSVVRSSGSEQGLLGLAFHPNYRTNGFFYVYYTEQSNRQTVVRYTARADRASGDPATARTILTMDDPYQNHNGGMLLFDRAGMLLVGTGDGGSAGDPQRNGQNLNSLLGKILRLDVNSGDPYGIPADNPFVNRQGARPEVWMYGLRNPWRFSMDRQSNDLWIGDVGQNAYEEVNLLPGSAPAGSNFGWNRMEGSQCFPANSTCDQNGLVLPVAEYGTGREGCSITGGYVYRGTVQPSLAGQYLFTDYCTGTIWSLTRDGTTWKRTEMRRAPGGNAAFSSMGEGADGEIYVTSLQGTVYRVTAR